MTDKKHKLNGSRRKFLQNTAAASAAAAVVASTVSSPASASTEVETKPAKEGYRLTKHIMDYYKSTTL